MKRRTFIKRGSLGLSALVAGVAGLKGAPGPGSGRIYGVPESVRPRSPLDQNLLRLSLAQTDLPPEAWQDVAALSMLAQDVFADPEVARSFTRSPRAYLRSIGMNDVKLDPDSIEVKTALAIGDPDVRDAIEREDARAFLQAIEARGLLRSPEPSQLARKIGRHLDALKSRFKDGASPESCAAAVICVVAVWVYAVVVQDAVVAVALAVFVSVYAIAMVHTRVSGPKRRPRPDAGVLSDQPSVRLAGALGGAEFGDKVADAFVEDNVERIATAVESLDQYRDAGVMSPESLRGLIRNQMLRSLSGQALDLGEAQP